MSKERSAYLYRFIPAVWTAFLIFPSSAAEKLGGWRALYADQAWYVWVTIGCGLLAAAFSLAVAGKTAAPRAHLARTVFIFAAAVLIALALVSNVGRMLLVVLALAWFFSLGRANR